MASSEQGSFGSLLVATLCLPNRYLVEELTALLCSPVGRVALPELWALNELSDDAGGAHKDNFAHSIAVTAQCGQTASLQLRLAALFHDVGKANTRRFAAGKVTFHGHELVGVHMTSQRLDALGLATEATAVTTIITASARLQSWDPQWSDSAIRRLTLDARDRFDDAVLLARADCTSRHAHVHSRVQTTVDGAVAHAVRVRDADERARQRPSLNGHDLSALGIPKGPVMGELLRWLLAENRDGRLQNRDDAVAALRSHPKWVAAHKKPL